MTTAALPSRWVKPTRRGLRIEVPARFNSFVRALLGSWLAFWAAAMVIIALGWLGVIAARIPAAPIWIVFILSFTAAGAFVAWHLAWVLQGREIIELKDGVLSISRGIGPWIGRPKSHPWRDVQELRAESFRRDRVYPSWGRQFVGKGDGYVAFESGGHSHHFARGVSLEEARELVELLRGSNDESA